jgi:hypothetical protein
MDVHVKVEYGIADLVQRPGTKAMLRLARSMTIWALASILLAPTTPALAQQDSQVIGSDRQTGGATQEDAERMQEIQEGFRRLRKQAEEHRRTREEQQALDDLMRQEQQLQQQQQ